jgi:hydroxymethylbilane synthase
MTSPHAAVLRVGTRASALARWQAARVCEALAAAGFRTETIEIHTTGDLAPEVPIGQLSDPALFTRQLDEAMLDERIDLAVHSLKDLPTRLPGGIALVAVSTREDARDALITRDGSGFAALPHGARIATSSLRRRAQLLSARPDLDIVEVRGNVDTRLAKLDRNLDVAATMLASAGLVRLGLGHRISERLSYELMLPAPGQAALAVTARSGDAGAAAAAQRAVHDPRAAACVGAERALLHALEGGCEVPVAALGELVDPMAAISATRAAVLRLRGRVVSLDGVRVVEGVIERTVHDQPSAEAAGQELAAQLVADGAGRILEALRSPTAGPSV